MINKSIYVIMFMLSINGGLLIVQYSIADLYGMELKNLNNEPIKSHVVDVIRIGTLNEVTQNIQDTNFNGTVNGQPFNRVIDFNQAMAYSVFELARLLTGTQIFYIMMQFGVPEFVVAIMVVPYIFLLIRTMVGLLRGF